MSDHVICQRFEASQSMMLGFGFWKHFFFFCGARGFIFVPSWHPDDWSSHLKFYPNNVTDITALRKWQNISSHLSLNRVKNWFWKPWINFCQEYFYFFLLWLQSCLLIEERKLTIDALLRQEKPDKNPPPPVVIWAIVLGDLEQLWAQSGRPDKIARLAHNSTIFSLVLLSKVENVGHRKDVDVLIQGGFTLAPACRSSWLTEKTWSSH